MLPSKGERVRLGPGTVGRGITRPGWEIPKGIWPQHLGVGPPWVGPSWGFHLSQDPFSLDQAPAR